MSDLLFQQLSTVQSNLQPTPPTIASATTIAPSTRLTFVTGVVAVATITPPVTGYHELLLVFTNAAPAAMLTTGNIKTAFQPIQNLPVLLCYDPVTALYWGSVGTLT